MDNETLVPQSERQSEEQLQQHGERVEQLLRELESLAGPLVWPRVEQLVSALLAMYGQGIERLLELARRRAPAELDDRLVADAFVAALLSLHGLHPHGLPRRVQRVVQDARQQLPATPADVELVDIRAEVARLRLIHVRDASRAPAWAEFVKRAVLAGVPELASVEIDGVPEQTSPGPKPNLVSIERLRRRAGT